MSFSHSIYSLSLFHSVWTPFFRSFPYKRIATKTMRSAIEYFAYVTSIENFMCQIQNIHTNYLPDFESNCNVLLIKSSFFCYWLERTFFSSPVCAKLNDSKLMKFRNRNHFFVSFKCNAKNGIYLSWIVDVNRLTSFEWYSRAWTRYCKKGKHYREEAVDVWALGMTSRSTCSDGRIERYECPQSERYIVRMDIGS